MSSLSRMLAPGAIPRVLMLEDVVFAVLLAFVLGQLTAWIYKYTHSGLSYSKNFVQSIVLLTLVVSVAMMVIGNNIVVAFGLIGALAVIRFRNILKDTRDTAFIFLALVVGMACGTGNHHLAVAGTAAFCLTVLYLNASHFGSRNPGDGFVRFQIDTSRLPLHRVHQIIKRHCRSAQLVSQRFEESGPGEMAYRMVMRYPERSREMVDELKALDGISSLAFTIHEDQDEI